MLLQSVVRSHSYHPYASLPLDQKDKKGKEMLFYNQWHMWSATPQKENKREMHFYNQWHAQLHGWNTGPVNHKPEDNLLLPIQKP
jgi:hypothetical protein